ncbi:response regulator [Pirellulales bacterium]|nr:response regulator [Pirellulales bacterium]
MAPSRSIPFAKPRTGEDLDVAITPSATVFIVDDDPDVRRSIGLLARSVNLDVLSFGNAQDFLDSYTVDQPGCLVLDVRMPGLSGLQLQRKLKELSWRIPVIIVTAHAEVSMATRVMRDGAVDFIQKPYSPQLLLERIHEAIELDVNIRQKQRKLAKIQNLLATLTPREQEVTRFLATGRSTKQIANSLDISIKTVDNHRASILEKMRVDNTTQLASLLGQLESL